jgi:hypothetical protein
MTRLREVSREDLLRSRRQLLEQLGVGADELHRRAAAGALVGDEWAGWDRLRDIEFLLGDDDHDR